MLGPSVPRRVKRRGRKKEEGKKREKKGEKKKEKGEKRRGDHRLLCPAFFFLFLITNSVFLNGIGFFSNL